MWLGMLCYARIILGIIGYATNMYNLSYNSQGWLIGKMTQYELNKFPLKFSCFFFPFVVQDTARHNIY